MNLTAPGKLVVLALIVVGAFIALCLGDLTETTFIAIVGPIAGYLVGNGVGALKGLPQAPVFAPSPPPAPLTPAEARRLEWLLARLAALDERERAELTELARRGAPA